MTITNFDKKMLKIAREIASTSDFKNFHIGCVIAYKKHVVAVGVNSHKTHSVQKRYNKKYRVFAKTNKPIRDSLHAEIDCITKIAYSQLIDIDWKKASIYIYRICRGKPLKMGMARPCPSCMNAIIDLGIRRVVYSTDNGYAVEKIVKK